MKAIGLAFYQRKILFSHNPYKLYINGFLIHFRIRKYHWYLIGKSNGVFLGLFILYNQISNGNFFNIRPDSKKQIRNLNSTLYKVLGPKF